MPLYVGSSVPSAPIVHNQLLAPQGCSHTQSALPRCGGAAMLKPHLMLQAAGRPVVPRQRGWRAGVCLLPTAAASHSAAPTHHYSQQEVGKTTIFCDCWTNNPRDLGGLYPPLGCSRAMCSCNCSWCLGSNGAAPQKSCARFVCPPSNNEQYAMGHRSKLQAVRGRALTGHAGGIPAAACRVPAAGAKGGARRGIMGIRQSLAPQQKLITVIANTNAPITNHYPSLARSTNRCRSSELCRTTSARAASLITCIIRASKSHRRLGSASVPSGGRSGWGDPCGARSSRSRARHR